jgi:hypothetical protein
MMKAMNQYLNLYNKLIENFGLLDEGIENKMTRDKYPIMGYFFQRRNQRRREGVSQEQCEHSEIISHSKLRWPHCTRKIVCRQLKKAQYK